MRIVLLNHNVAGVGTYQRAFHIGVEAAARGHDVTLITTHRDLRLRGRESMVRGVRIVEAPDLLAGGARQGWDVWNTYWRASRLAGVNADLIHAFDARPVVIGPALALRRRTGAPLFLDWADWWGRGGTITERSGRLVRTLFGPVETWFEEAFRGRATANTVISSALRERCIGLGVPGERVHAMPNGCSAVRARDTMSRRDARRDLGIRPGESIVVHVGAMQPADATLLFDAFRILHEQDPYVRLVLIGRFRARVPADLARNGRVTATGFVAPAALWQWLVAADVGVVPLRDNVANRARWPGKINDYWSAQLPVVLPDVGPAAEHVAKSGCGATCRSDARSLAAAVSAILHDETASARMSERAGSLATRLSWSAVTAELFDFYDRWTEGAASVDDVTRVTLEA